MDGYHLDLRKYNILSTYCTIKSLLTKDNGLLDGRLLCRHACVTIHSRSQLNIVFTPRNRSQNTSQRQ